ncbi:MAG: discoidin domain-containing protein, partial [Christensenellales bacterium]
EVASETGSRVKVTDYLSFEDNKLFVDREIEVLAVGDERGFTTEFVLFSDKQDSVAKNDWFNPAQYYITGEHTFLNTTTRTGFAKEEAIISADNTSALMLCKYRDGKAFTVYDNTHSQLVTTYEDVVGEENNLIIDEDISITGIGFGNYYEGEECFVKLSFCYPSREELWSGDNTVWRLFPLDAGLKKEVSFVIAGDECEDFESAVELTWRTYYDNNAVTDRRYSQKEVYSVLTDSMQRSFSETNIWGNVPQYLTNADHYFPESGFLYRNTELALLMYKAGVRLSDEEYKAAAIKVLTYQVQHDKPDTGITAYQKGNSVYYRVRYESLSALIDVYRYFRDNGIEPGGVLEQNYLKSYILKKAELYKDETSVMGLPFYMKMWKYAEEFSADYSETALRLLDKAAVENRDYLGYFGSVESSDVYINVAEDLAIFLTAYLDAYEITGVGRWLERAEICATQLETFNMIQPMNLCLKGDDGTLDYNSAFIGNERFLAYGYNFNNTRHCILDCATVTSAIDFGRLYEITEDVHYLDFAERLVYNSSIYVNMGDKVGQMDDPLHSSGTGFINEFVGNTASKAGYADAGIRGAAHDSNIAWCGYQLTYVYDYLFDKGNELAERVFATDRTYNLAAYKQFVAENASGDGHGAKSALDGKKETYWQASAQSKLIVDLNEICEIKRIVADITESATGNVLNVRISPDGRQYSDCLTGKAIAEGANSFETPVYGRYIEIYFSEDTKVAEISVFGLPAFYYNFSGEATVIAGDTEAVKALDPGNYGTVWNITEDESAVIDLGREADIFRCALKFEGKGSHSYKLEVSTDNETWETYSQCEDIAKYVYVDEGCVTARYIRISVSVDDAVALCDLKISGRNAGLD